MGHKGSVGHYTFRFWGEALLDRTSHRNVLSRICQCRLQIWTIGSSRPQPKASFWICVASALVPSRHQDLNQLPHRANEEIIRNFIHHSRIIRRRGDSPVREPVLRIKLSHHPPGRMLRFCLELLHCEFSPKAVVEAIKPNLRIAHVVVTPLILAFSYKQVFGPEVALASQLGILVADHLEQRVGGIVVLQFVVNRTYASERRQQSTFPLPSIRARLSRSRISINAVFALG